MHSFYFIGITFIAALMATHVFEAKPTSDDEKPGLLDEMPTECKNQTFCFHPHRKYPSHIISYLLTKKKILLRLLDRDDLRHRQGTDDADNRGCAKTRPDGQVHEIVDTEGRVRVVVQLKLIFEQWITLEQCLNGTRRITNKTDPSNINLNKRSLKTPTAKLGYRFKQVQLTNHHIYCAQKTLEYGFLVLTEDAKDVEFVRVKNGIPMGCVYELRNY